MNKSLLLPGIATLAVGVLIIILIEAYFLPQSLCQCPPQGSTQTVTCTCPAAVPVFPANLVGIIFAAISASTSMIGALRS